MYNMLSSFYGRERTRTREISSESEDDFSLRIETSIRDVSNISDAVTLINDALASNDNPIRVSEKDHDSEKPRQIKEFLEPIADQLSTKMSKDLYIAMIIYSERVLNNIRVARSRLTVI